MERFTLRISGFPFALFSFVLFVLLNPAAYAARTKPVRMVLGFDNELTIGKHLPAFAYDGREGQSLGVMENLGNGVARVLFRAADTQVPPLYMFPPATFARVEITPNDLVGEIDFCSGEARLSFDARFVPRLFNAIMADLTVVTELTTGESAGEFRTLQGGPLDLLGNIHLVGVARVPKTGDLFVNWLLQLPTDAATDMNAHWDFPDGIFPCPGAQPVVAAKARLAIGKEGRLQVSRWPRFRYDPMGANVTATVNWLAGTQAHVSFPAEELNIPPLKLLGNQVPGGIGVIIEPRALEGVIDICSGEANLDFDAVFTPYLFGRIWDTGIEVVTALTTGKSAGYFQEVEGTPLDQWGDGKLVGVAQVPLTDDDFINRFLRLPTDAVAELPSHIDIEGGWELCD